jgi:CRISPR-associated protein Csd1
MLVQALADYADTHLSAELNDAAWEMKPVPWILEISRQGTFLHATPRMATETRGKKQVQVPLPMNVPRSPVNRNSGEHPLLGTDDIAYVLGVGAWTSDKDADKDRAGKHHEAFVALIAKVAVETEDAALTSCVRFYSNADEVEKARNALHEAKPGSLVALSVGEPLVELESVQGYWRKHYDAAFAGRMEGIDGECMISGIIGPIAPTHEKIKGLSSLGGQAAGVALMSFDKEAFRSYGWEQNHNSPISPGRALAYVLALNDLLKQDKGRRVDIAGIGFLYWLRNPDDINTIDPMDRYDPKQVKDMLARQERSEHLDSNRFYLVAVSGNGGRLRVHHWVDLGLAEVKRNIANWDEQLRVEFPLYAGEEPSPVRLWQLLYALEREGKPDDHTVLALLRRRIEGLPLGYSVLSTALTRLRHPGGSDLSKAGDKKSDSMSLARLRVPMGLIRMCINDLLRQQKGKSEMSEGLDSGCTIPAYVCGRLMAEFENLQRAASESEVNSSVLDRYFALASTYPAVAFPKIESLAQKHLRKLRRDKPPAAYAIDGRLQELHNLLQPSACGAYPGKLGLEGQGLFALGYYHQKARSRTQAQDRKLANETAGNSQSDTSEEEKN